MAKCTVTLLLGLLLLISDKAFAQNVVQSVKNVQICGDDAEWPPFLYYARKNGEKSEQLIGFSLDVIGEIFKRNDIVFTIKMLPWSRCQKSVEIGHYDMFLDGSFSDRRNKHFILSKGYYQLNYLYYYAKSIYPDGLNITSKQYVLDNLKQCGIRGSEHGAFNYPEGFVNNLADNWDTLYKLLKFRPKLCNFATVPDTVVAGYIAIGKPYFTDDSMGFGRYPDIAPRTYHMAVSKQTIYGQKLTGLINRTLMEMVKDGTYKRLADKYQLPPETLPLQP